MLISTKADNLYPLRRLLSTPQSTSAMNTLLPSCLIRMLSKVSLPFPVVEHIVSFLRVERVRREEVRVTGCSSTRGDFPLSAVLEDDERKWWISAPGSMRDGYGMAYLEFDLGSCVRR